jgi:hypothetical protein
VDDERMKKLEEKGLAGEVTEIDGKKVIQVGMTKKDQKKLLKGFKDLQFDANNACTLPEEADNKLMDIILEMGTTDVMKVAISKLYNPLAGRDVFGRGTGMR